MKLTKPVEQGSTAQPKPQFAQEIQGNNFAFLPTRGILWRRGITRNNYEVIVIIRDDAFIQASFKYLPGFYDAGKPRAQMKPLHEHAIDSAGRAVHKKPSKGTD